MMKRECDNTIMLQCDNAAMPEWVFALKEQVNLTQGNALGWKATRTSAPWFNAPTLATGNIAVPFMGRTVNSASPAGLQPHILWLKPGFDATTDRWLPACQSGRKPTEINGKMINDYRLTIDDFRIEEMKNIQYRISNNETGSEEVTTMLQCDNAAMPEWVFALKGQVNSAQGNALGWKATSTTAPWFNAPNPVANEGYKFQQVRVNLLQGRVNLLQGQVSPLQGRVNPLQGSRYFQQVRVTSLQGSQYFQQVWVTTLQGSRYFQQGTVSAVPASLSDSIFSENVKYRIRNNESGNEGMSYKLTTTYPFPNNRDRQLQTCGRREACQRATHLTTLVNTPVKTTPTGLTTLTGWATLSGCGKNEIQFSRYLASGETVIHRAQAVRACLPPFLQFFLNNN